jgi:hypothetical protein
MWKLVGLATAGLLIATQTAFPVQLRQMTLSEQVREADVVVIARATSNTREPRGREWADLAVEVALKGRPAKSFVLLLYTGISEETPNCCKVGERYLLLLKRTRDGKYVSVNGAFATIPIGPNASVFPGMPNPWLMEGGEFHHPE